MLLIPVANLLPVSRKNSVFYLISFSRVEYKNFYPAICTGERGELFAKSLRIGRQILRHMFCYGLNTKVLINCKIAALSLKGLSYEIDFKKVNEN